jgi:pilus assembly protein Flp/PilA
VFPELSEESGATAAAFCLTTSGCWRSGLPKASEKNIFGGMHMSQLFIRLWKEDEGQDLTEYALLLVLLSLAAIATLGTLANAINSVFNQAASNLTT